MRVVLYILFHIYLSAIPFILLFKGLDEEIRVNPDKQWLLLAWLFLFFIGVILFFCILNKNKIIYWEYDFSKIFEKIFLLVFLGSVLFWVFVLIGLFPSFVAIWCADSKCYLIDDIIIFGGAGYYVVLYFYIMFFWSRFAFKYKKFQNKNP